MIESFSKDQILTLTTNDLQFANTVNLHIDQIKVALSN